MSVDLEKIKSAKGRTYIISENCPMPICIEDYLEYKNIEDMYGIDLITLFKALKNGVYWKDILGNFHIVIKFSKPGSVRINDGAIYVYDEKEKRWADHLLIKDYGKTWTLTKEELE